MTEVATRRPANDESGAIRPRTRSWQTASRCGLKHLTSLSVPAISPRPSPPSVKTASMPKLSNGLPGGKVCCGSGVRHTATCSVDHFPKPHPLLRGQDQSNPHPQVGGLEIFL